MKLTLIPKASVLEDIKKPWTDSGREYNGDDGEFAFESEQLDAELDNGVLKIKTGNNMYLYNMADFYRVKLEVTE